MTVSILTSALAALAMAGAPPAGAGADDEPVFRYNDREVRARALQAEFEPDEEACPNSAGSAVLVTPVTDGRLLFAYAFVTPRLCLARGVNEFAITGQMHFIVDEMVRAAHRTPMTLNDDMTIDRDATRQAMLDAARSVVGVDRIESLQLLGGDVRALR